jgi:lysyl-tRNA synthetase class I
MNEVNMEDKYTHWVFDHTEEMLNSKKKMDIYTCAACGYEHKVPHEYLPTMPFCWQCKRIVKEDAHE